MELACSLRVFDRGRTHATAAIVDLSANGLAVLTSISIAAGTSTVIQQAGFLTLAEVRNCRRDGHAFRIGLRASRVSLRSNLAALAEESVRIQGTVT